MKIAIISDVHDNIERFSEIVETVKIEKISNCICCGDITSINTLDIISNTFKKIFLAFGNADYDIKMKIELIPENIKWDENLLEFEIDKLKCATIHNTWTAKKIAESEKYDFIFSGHSHTPWAEKIGKTTIINPGEVCGREGKPSFAIFDTKTKKAKLILLK